jgi:hypothetical protein
VKQAKILIEEGTINCRRELAEATVSEVGNVSFSYDV